ncbi:MAG TPA: rod shape-determining protein [Cyclobacteriaceae bacterium]|nr:rod shape-determining protein [Cyclobacteriaceae bacterium]
MINIPFLSSKSFAIDLGNNNTLLTNDQGVLMCQPSYIAFDSSTHKVKAVGDAAYNMYEKNHAELSPVKPLRGGVIADYESAASMIHEMVQRVYPKKWFSLFSHIISGVPYGATEVERRALRDAMDQFQSRKTNLLFEPLAAATGIGLDIRTPEGKMVVDIGGGVTEIVVISLSGIAVFHSTKVAGDTFTEEIRDAFRRNYNMAIGFKTAEQVKMQTGMVWNRKDVEPTSMMVKGKDVMEGIPVTRTISSVEVMDILDKPFRSIEEGIVHALEVCPPELAGDIYERGIHITGGGALLQGVRERLEHSFQVPIHIDDEPLLAVSKGIAQALRDPKKFRAVLVD